MQTVKSTPKSFNYPLLLAPFISRLGDALYLFGLNWFVVKATDNASLLGIIQATGGVVLFFGDLLCGVVVDNLNRKWIVVSAELLSILGCLGCAFWLNPQRITAAPLITLTILLDIGLAFSLPAAKAMIPELITLSGRQRFNAVSNTLIDLADICAPLLGGLLLTLHWLDLRGFLLLNAGSFVLSFILYLSIRYQAPSGKSSQLGVRDSLVTGWQYVWRRPGLVETIALGGLINVLFAAVRLVLPYDVQHLYAGDSSRYSYLLVMLAVGGILGGLRLTLDHRDPSAVIIIWIWRSPVGLWPGRDCGRTTGFYLVSVRSLVSAIPVLRFGQLPLPKISRRRSFSGACLGFSSWLSMLFNRSEALSLGLSRIG